ncbi:hypothetical protein HN499_01665 [archaeon]|nr:hypothetical protein [archaeon]
MKTTIASYPQSEEQYCRYINALKVQLHEIDWETCRQSVILRSSIPSQDLILQDFASARDSFPLKCKTEVINIDYKNTSRLENDAMEVMRSCWALFDDGAGGFFPVNRWSSASFCIPCARIHLDSSVADYYQGNNSVNFTRAFRSKIPGSKFAYRDYFQRRNPGYSAFSYLADPPWAETFTMKKIEKVDTQKSYDAIMGIIAPFKKTSENLRRMQIPSTWDVKASPDLLIVIYQVVFNFEKDDPIKQFEKVHMAFMTADRVDETEVIGLWGWENTRKMCENWEGIPA